MQIQPHGTLGMSLRSVFPTAHFVGDRNLRATSCSADSRRVRPGDVFVAVTGEHSDGHLHVHEAVTRGAVAIVAQRPLAGLGVPVCVVPDTRVALGQLCQALAGDPSERLKVVGVTGTNGKTTCSYLIASVLGVGGAPTGVMGTLGSSDGAEADTTGFTTPPAPVLADWLARTEANGCTHAVMEVSSHALAQSRVAGIRFDMAGVTNVRHDHLDFHGTPEEYLAAKARLFEHLTPEGVALLNADDPACEALLSAIEQPALTIGIDNAAEITGEIIEQTVSDQTFLLTAGSETMPVRTPLIGKHNVYNCLVAAAAGFAYGLDMFTIVRGLEAIDAMPGRLERIECGQPFSVFVDYAHTPDALTAVLHTLKTVTSGRVICVFGAGGDRDRFKRPLMGRAAEKLSDLVVLTSDNPRSEEPLAIIEDIRAGFRNPHKAQTAVDRGEAIRLALRLAAPGDCVLIAGKGHETYQIVGERQSYFDDREFARQCLYDGVDTEPTLRVCA